jgi:hypothetical protein
MSSPVEEQLTQALAPHAAAADTTDEAWATVVIRGRTIRRRDTRRRVAAVVTVAAVMIGAVVVVGLERARRDDNVTFGRPPRAAVDPDLVELSRRSIVLADAVAHEGAVAAAQPPVPADLLTAARAATDAAVGAWRPLADGVAAGHPNSAVAAINVNDRLANLAELRRTRDQHTSSYIELNRHLVEEAVDVAHESATAAPSAGAASQLADASAIASVALDWWRLPALVGTYNFVYELGRAAESARRLEDQMAPSRRAAVAAVLADTRLDDALAAQAATPAPDPALAPLAADRQARLVALALDTLARTPDDRSDVDPALAHAVMTDALRLRAARDLEVWALLVGDPGELATARAEVDAAVATARRSRDRLRDATGVELDGSSLADQVAAQEISGRPLTDSGTADPVASAWSVAMAAQAESRVLEATAELGPVEHYRRVQVTDALSVMVSHLTLASALALRRLDNAPVDHAGGVDANALVDLVDRRMIDDDQFQRYASAEDRPRWRSESDAAPVGDFLERAVYRNSPGGDGRPWTVQRDEMRTHLDNSTATVARFAG